MKTWLWLAALITLFAFSCTEPRFVVSTRMSVPLVVRPASPGAGYIWIEGEWFWNGSSYTWRNGYWSFPSRGYVWAPGSWHPRAHGWYWRPGGWKR